MLHEALGDCDLCSAPQSTLARSRRPPPPRATSAPTRSASAFRPPYDRRCRGFSPPTHPPTPPPLRPQAACAAGFSNGTALAAPNRVVLVTAARTPRATPFAMGLPPAALFSRVQMCCSSSHLGPRRAPAGHPGHPVLGRLLRRRERPLRPPPRLRLPRRGQPDARRPPPLLGEGLRHPPLPLLRCAAAPPLRPICAAHVPLPLPAGPRTAAKGADAAPRCRAN